jgi:hypothetical protein
MTIPFRRLRVLASIGMLAGVLGASVAAPPVAAQTSTGPSAAVIRCQNPAPPTWFYPRLQAAANTAGDGVPSSWGSSVNMARIVCWESSFNVNARNGDHYGLGQMLPANIAAARVSFRCYWEGGCDRPKGYHQCLAALRYANQRYGSPAAGWQHIVNHGWW